MTTEQNIHALRLNQVRACADLESITARFEAKYTPEPMSGCWLWHGAADRKGYGKMNIWSGFWVKAHRLSYVLFNGPIEKLALHRCDNPACVNPAHLFDGSQAENIQDSWAKGRRNHVSLMLPRGECNNKAKLTSTQVSEARARMAAGVNPKIIAAEYGVTFATMYNVKNRKTWAHVPEARSNLAKANGLGRKAA